MFARTSVPRFGYAFCGDVIERQAPQKGNGLVCWLILESGRIELAEGERRRTRSARGGVDRCDRDPILFGSIQATFRAWRARVDVDTRTA